MALFADDAAVWKRGRNLNYVYKQLQQAFKKVEAWQRNGVLEFQSQNQNMLCLV